MFKKSYFIILFIGLMSAIVGLSSVARADDSQKFIVSVDNIAHFPFTDSGVFNTPTGAGGAGPLLPGQAYEWQFNAHPGDRLNFATMLVQSNDLFFAPNELGIALYDANGAPISGDVTHQVALWDAGTEGDEALGSGANQAPRQAGPDTGSDDPTNEVRQVLVDGLPAVNELVDVDVTALGNGRFHLRIQNVSGNSSFSTPLAPGVGVVHTNPAPLFVNGQADWGVGLEALAEDGNPAALASYLANRTGVNTPIAPVAWIVHTSPNALFTTGTAASAGLETLAEDGSPAKLVAELGEGNNGAAAVARGAAGPGPAFAPNGNYSFEITAVPGDHLSLASMFVQSNDWFFSVNNLPLFDADGDPRSGEVDGYLRLYDAGTEVNETPGFGTNQAPRQAGANTGATEGGVIHAVTDVAPANYVHITITPTN